MRAVARGALRRLAGQGSRGTGEIGMVVVIGALVAGGLVGIGLTDTVVSLSDGLSWIADDERGEVVQVNPDTGEPQVRLEIAEPGHELVVTQGDGLLVVTDLASGEVTVINTATLAVGGTRYGSGNGAVEILYDRTLLYLVDLALGVVQRIDPTTAADVGAPWTAGTRLVDAAIDGGGKIRALRTDGQLFTLGWSQDTAQVREVAPVRTVRGAGPGSVLVPHQRGVTVFAPDAGLAVRIDTGRDRSLPAVQLSPPLYPAPEAPVELVPVSMEQAGIVLVLYGDQLAVVDTNALGCRRPGQPVVFRGLVHVACLGAGKVIVLTRDGRDRPQDIWVGGRGDPELVLDDGRLIVHAAGSGVVVEPNGNTREIRTGGDSVPVRDPSNPPAPAPPPPPPPPPPGVPAQPLPGVPPPQDRPGQDRGGPPNPRPDNDLPPVGSGGPPPGTATPSPAPPGPPTPPTPPSPPTVPPPVVPPPTSPPPTSPPPTSSPPPSPPSPPPAPPVAPAGVTAQASPDGTVQVGWQSAQDPDQFRVLRGDTGGVLASVGGAARSATVTTLSPGESVTLVVEADYGGTPVRSAAVGPVTAFTTPGAPSGVTVSATGNGAGAVDIVVQWQPGADNGSALTGHTVHVTTSEGHDVTVQAGPGQTSATQTVTCTNDPEPPCGGALTVTADVRAVNTAGTGPAGTGSQTYQPTIAPVITQLFCEYTGNSSAFCEVHFTGAGITSIDWNQNQLDGRTVGAAGCSPSGNTIVSVTITNAAGSDTQSTRITRCSGPPL